MERSLLFSVFIEQLLKKNRIQSFVTFKNEIKFVIILCNESSFSKDGVLFQNVVVTLGIK